jgi:hypothetical protein
MLQDKQFHLQLKSEQKEIIQNVLERKDSMAVLSTGFGQSESGSFRPDYLFAPGRFAPESESIRPT